MVRIAAGLFALITASFFAGELQSVDRYRLLQLGGQQVKWGPPEFGTGASLTYAIVHGPATYSGERNCTLMGGIETLTQRSELTREILEAEVAAAFAMWGGVADIRYQMTSDPDAADILIGAQIEPRGRGYADISIHETAADQIGSIGKGLICLNPALKWVNGVSGEVDGARLRYTLAHEIGHLLGLDHPGAHGALMSFSYDDTLHGLQPGDIAGAVALYGPAQDAVRASSNDDIDKQGDIVRFNPFPATGGSFSFGADAAEARLPKDNLLPASRTLGDKPTID